MLNFRLQLEQVTVTCSSGSMNMLPPLEGWLRVLSETEAFFFERMPGFREVREGLRRCVERTAFFTPDRIVLFAMERDFDFPAVVREFSFPEILRGLVLVFPLFPEFGLLRFFICLRRGRLDIYVFCFFPVFVRRQNAAIITAGDDNFIQALKNKAFRTRREGPGEIDTLAWKRPFLQAAGCGKQTHAPGSPIARLSFQDLARLKECNRVRGLEERG